MRRQIGLFVLGIILISQVTVWAAEPPVGVSPGRADTGAVVESRCPTFSWGMVAGARGYELVVYRVTEDFEETDSILQESFPGSVHSWTPAIDRCLERGRHYAWSVRAVGAKETSKWSAPTLFEVASGPTELEFEEALELVRAYVDSEGGAGASAGMVGMAPEATELALGPNTEVSSPAPGVPAATMLTVDGNIDAVSFTGDGSALTGVGGGGGAFFIGGGWNNFQGMSTTNYYGMFHGFRGTAYSEVKSRIGTAGTITDFSAAVQAAEPTGSWKFTLFKNAAAQTVTCSISGANTSCLDTTHCVGLAAGDEIAVEVDPIGATANAGAPRWLALFTPSGSCP